MNDDWTFEATRTCQACGGSGKTRERPAIPGGHYDNESHPVECHACQKSDGTGKSDGKERRAFTIAELKDLLCAQA